MKALFYKDFLLLWVQYKFHMLILTCMGLIGILSDSSYMHAYCMLIMTTLVINLLQGDETCHWLTYIDTTAVCRKQVVQEKYLINLVLLFATVVFLGLFRVVSGLIHGNLVDCLVEYGGAALLMLTAGTLMTSISYPVIFRFGVTNGRLISLVFIGMIAGITSLGFVSVTVMSSVNMVHIPMSVLLLPTLVCTFIVYPLSSLVAVRWYEKRELA